MQISSVSMGVRNKMVPDPECFNDCWLAGGAVLGRMSRTDQISDFDIYPFTREKGHELVQSLIEDGFFVKNISSRAVTLMSNTVCTLNNRLKRRTIYQIITFQDFPTAQSIFETFDFTCVMAAQNLSTGELVVHNKFVDASLSKSIQFNSNTSLPTSIYGSNR